MSTTPFTTERDGAFFKALDRRNAAASNDAYAQQRGPVARESERFPA
jgi:hypothetical protein